MPDRILVLEDNKAHMDAMCSILEKLPCDIEVFRADSYRAAVQILAEYTVQVFILDIVLDTERAGDTSGLRLAELVRRGDKYKYTPIIFTTSVEDPKLYSYSQLHCFAYLEKPYDPLIVRKTVLEALAIPVVSDGERYVSFQRDYILYAKQIREIICLEVSRSTVTVYCVNDVLEVPYKSCKDLLRELDSEFFIQCSRYAIVNKTFIDSIDYQNRYIKLKDCDKQLEIGTIMKKEFREKMEKWYQRR